MERMSRLCVAVLVLVVMKFSLPCPEECFEWEKNSRNNCQCPRQHVEITMKCYSSRGQAVAANSVCSAEKHGLTCLNGVPTGFDQSVIGIHLNNLFNLTTLTKHDIPPLRRLIRLNIIGSTIQTIEAGAFSSVPAIQWITIKCSRLQHIGDEAIANLSKLMGIFLYHNLIETVSPRAFVHLNSLTTMILSQNQLKEVPFEALSLIRNSTTGDGVDVNLNNNRIATILEANWKKIVDKLLSIDLKGNPLVCDGRIRWLVCNTTKLNHGVLYQAGLLKCTSPPELAGYDFESLHTNSFCSSTKPTAKSLMTSTSAFPNARTSRMADPTNFPTENIRKTTSACTEQVRKTTSGTMDSTRGIALKKNLDDGQKSRTDYIYMPIAVTVGVIVLLGGTAVAVIMYKRHVSKRRQNPVHGQQGVIISSQLISNRMSPSGSATGDDRDKEEAEETEDDSARQNPVNKRHGVIIDTSQLISNQMYTSPASSANSANQGTETTKGFEENSELTPYLTVPLDAINNTLRIEPYSSVDLDDISSNEEMNDDLQLAPSPEHQDEDDMEPYSITPLDQIGDP
ncbi:uncharacterized protein LOC144909123 [Branchiostoma floridae x Branchiostoma belcheri]